MPSHYANLAIIKIEVWEGGVEVVPNISGENISHYGYVNTGIEMFLERSQDDE